jgi:hypothetical protein
MMNFADDDAIAEGECTAAEENENQGVINRSKTQQNAYGINGQLTFDDDWQARRKSIDCWCCF